MKKIVSIVAILVVFSAVFTAKANASDQVWVKSQSGPGEFVEEVYSIQNGNVFCTVGVMKDGDITVFGIDSNWNGRVARQYAHVGAKSGFVKNDVTVSTMHHGADYDYFIYEEGGYWVFSEKCSTLAQKLPSEVRSKFSGAFGVK